MLYRGLYRDPGIEVIKGDTIVHMGFPQSGVSCEVHCTEDYSMQGLYWSPPI